MIMQKEQLAAGVAKKKVTTQAITAAVEPRTQIDLTAATVFTAAEQPSTEELVEHV